MRLLWLPERLRAWGLDVVEVPGWQDRGRDFLTAPRVAIGHHTATPARVPGDLPTLPILRDGRPDLRGPLCQVATGRSGTAYVLAAGKANHAGRGAWRGSTRSDDTVGNEVEHPGIGLWSPAQLDAFDLVMAALLDGLDQSAEQYCGHREWALPRGRKVDPGGVDLDAQRDRIARLLRRGPLVDSKPKLPEVLTDGDDMPVIAKGTAVQAWLTDLGSYKRWIKSEATVSKLRRDGTRFVTGPEYDSVLAPLPEGEPIA